MSLSFRVPTCYQLRPIQFPVANLSSNSAHKIFIGCRHQSCYQPRPIQFPVAELSSNSTTNYTTDFVTRFFNCAGHQPRCQPRRRLPAATFFSITTDVNFWSSILLPTPLSNSYRHHLRQQPRRWFWKWNQSATLLPTSLIKAAKVISNASKFADQTACNFYAGMLP